MEEYIKFENFKDYLETLESEEQVFTAIKFISENPDCGVDVVQMAVEIQHA
jgi:hypothetical protein